MRDYVVSPYDECFKYLKNVPGILLTGIRATTCFVQNMRNNLIINMQPKKHPNLFMWMNNITSYFWMELGLYN